MLRVLTRNCHSKAPGGNDTPARTARRMVSLLVTHVPSRIRGGVN
jgi:hypothetical protein